MMPLLGKSRVDQAGAQTARATLFRPLPPAAPLLCRAAFASFNNKILLSICATIRTPFKLLTLFFSFPSFYERQTPFPSPFPPSLSKPLTHLDAKPQRHRHYRRQIFSDQFSILSIVETIPQPVMPKKVQISPSLKNIANPPPSILGCPSRIYQFMTDYKVQFDVFEGPLDLLLYLIRKEEVDIYEVNLTRLATQFIEYVEVMRLLDLDFAGEFLVMASTLMYIKSRELLPKDQQTENIEEDDGQDPRWELIRQLVEYKKFKDAAAQLQAREFEQENVFPRLPVLPDASEPRAPAPPEASLFDLLNAVNQVLKQVGKREVLRDIFEDKWTISEKIEQLAKLIAEKGTLKFSDVFSASASRSEVICAFLALLELIRLKQLICTQPEPFGEIEIMRAPALPVAPTVTAAS